MKVAMDRESFFRFIHIDTNSPLQQGWRERERERWRE
jgi:hypothetical protein